MIASYHVLRSLVWLQRGGNNVSYPKSDTQNASASSGEKESLKTVENKGKNEP
jgi:hypothetical protein